MLENKIIIITGGNGLIGKSIVSYLKHQKAIVINAEINIETDIESGNVYCDITNDESIFDLINLVLAKYGRIDGLVNNAYPRTSDWGTKFENVSGESWRKNVDMQMNSVFVISQKVLEVMKKQNSGSIVNITSIYGVVGNDFTVYDNTNGMTSPAAYSAIKGGIINFTRYLASYYGKFNIRVNCVSPGGIFDNQNENFVKNFEQKVPMKRMGKPSDISPSVSFLLSDESLYITGQNIIIDGGWTAI
jgi:NAD(P)-dependent dehydrogenase (short-subunit alcohol dehydrogenase family)